MKKHVSLAFLTASFVLLTGFHGGCGSHDPAKRAERMQRRAHAHVEDLLEDVDADATQTKRILGHTDAVAAQAVQIHLEHRAVVEELHAQWKSPKPDAEKIHGLIDTRVDAFRRFLHFTADALIDTHQTLTPEQREAVLDEIH